MLDILRSEKENEKEKGNKLGGDLLNFVTEMKFVGIVGVIIDQMTQGRDKNSPNLNSNSICRGVTFCWSKQAESTLIEFIPY